MKIDIEKIGIRLTVISIFAYLLVIGSAIFIEAVKVIWEAL